MIGKQPKGVCAHLPLAYPALMLGIFFIIPFGIMVAISFFHRQPGGFYIPGFELTNYKNLYTGLFGRTLLFSLFVAGLSAATCVSLGFPFTYFITRMRRRNQVIWLVFLISVLLLSEVIIGFAWALLLVAMISGYAFAFVLSLNESIVAYIVAGFTVETLTIKIFNSLRHGYTPVMASVTVTFVLLADLMFGLIGRFGDLPKLIGALNPEEK